MSIIPTQNYHEATPFMASGRGVFIVNTCVDNVVNILVFVVWIAAYVVCYFDIVVSSSGYVDRRPDIVDCFIDYAVRMIGYVV